MKPIVYIIIVVVILLLMINFKCTEPFGTWNLNLKIPNSEHELVCPKDENSIPGIFMRGLHSKSNKINHNIQSKEGCIIKAKSNNHMYATLINYDEKSNKGLCFTSIKRPNDTPGYRCYFQKCDSVEISGPDGKSYESTKTCKTEPVDKTTRVFKLSQ